MNRSNAIDRELHCQTVDAAEVLLDADLGSVYRLPKRWPPALRSQLAIALWHKHQYCAEPSLRECSKAPGMDRRRDPFLPHGA